MKESKNKNYDISDNIKLFPVSNPNSSTILNSESDPQNDLLDTRIISTSLLQFWKIIVTISLLFATIGYFYSDWLRPVYKASATLKVTSNTEILNSDTNVQLYLDNSWEQNNTTKKELIGEDLGIAVLQSTGLLQEPEFKGEQQQRSIKSVLIGWLSNSKKDRESTPNADTSYSAEHLAGTIYARNIEIEEVKNTKLVILSYSSFNPNHAALVVNSIADRFNRLQQIEQANEAETSLKRLGAELSEIQAKLRVSEQKVLDFNLNAIALGTIDADQQNSTEIDLLTADLSDGQSRLRNQKLVLDQLANTNDRNRIVQLLPDTEHIQELINMLSEAQARKNKLSQTFGAKYPPVIKVNFEISELESRIEKEIASAIKQFRNQTKDLITGLEALKTELNSKHGTLLDLKHDSINIDLLKREIDADKSLYDSLLQEIKRASLQSNLVRERVKLVQTARVPTTKVFPNTAKLTVSSGFIGLFLSIALIFVLTLRDNRYRSIRALEEFTNLPVMGLIHSVKKGDSTDRQDLALQSIRFPRSALAEAYRTLNTNISYQKHQSSEAQVLQITSTMSNEGKSTTIVNLATILAKNANKVALVDFDLRRPSLHQLLGIDQESGISGMVSNDKVKLCPTEQANLFFLPAGKPSDKPVDILESKKCLKLIQQLQFQFDYVLLDSPPTLGIADAVVISQYADAVLVCIDLDKTDKYKLDNTLKRLHRVHAPVVGMVVTNYIEGQTDDIYYNSNLYNYE